MLRTKLYLLLLLLLVSAFAVSAQNPVKWSFSARDAGNCQVDLVFTGTIDDGWFTYSQFLESEDGPVATQITFSPGPGYKLVGKAKESGDIIKVHDKVFDMELTKFKHKAVLTQRITVADPSKPITGYLNFMVCNDEMCLPPKDVDFSFKIPALANCTNAAGGKTGAVPAQEPDATGAVLKHDTSITQIVTAPGVQQSGEAGAVAPDDANFKGFFYSKRPEINSAQFVGNCNAEVSDGSSEGASLVSLFLFCFLGGLIALLTPCVFPMIPMTVSFFVKRSKDRKTGLRNAFIYAASIVLIFVALGSAVTAALGPTALNDMSTNKYFNLVVFALLVVFAFSFFGFYEITLPSSWVNKSDKMADRGGLVGTFFMAFTLVLVSFSCTGPIVGTLLVEAARSNAGASLFGFIPMKPAIGMFGFGLGLALPFGLFAMFPGWLNSLPKSGGWMDNIKITLGLVELALALKFLSTADMVEQWGLLRFETFLALWVIIALALAVYQFGLIPWKGNSGRPGPARLAVGITSLVFAAYVGWGLLNYQSLSLLSGLAPPVHYSYKFANDKQEKHHDGPGCPQGLDCYHDFDEALAEAKRQNKPVFVDFTGHGCVNCRKMEENVWPLPGIIDRLRNDYIVVSLYVDEKVRLFPGNDFAYLLDPKTGEKLRTVGSKWSAFQVNNFDVSAQPYYVLMHNDGKTLLNKPTDYRNGHDPKAYKAFLDCGYEAFQRLEAQQKKELIGSR
ncbi:MAG TPA: cytochrome c biogenesis protein CcdA [Saprospiraceae bacterium]|nr:cytochrome c biogenesis protein CcdA [Saprospiraceae bacterium]HPI08223.1 cytochrome c biogenesis protein CcdA [Saprospiraceae bacterium]